MKDKNGAGRHRIIKGYFSEAVFGNEVKVGHVYQSVPRLAPETAVSVSYQTSATKNSGTKPAADAQKKEGSIFDHRSVRHSCKQFMEASAFQLG